MRIKVNKVKQIADLERLAEKESEVDEKIDAVIALITQNEFDSQTVKQFQQRFNRAIEKKDFSPKQLDPFKAIGKKEDASREELLDEFSVLFLSNKIDSNISKKYIKSERIINSTLALLGIVMITLGFAMIIMPATHDFEMFTIFWFNPDDGVTLMDLISLAIIFAGVYVLVRAIYKRTMTSN